MEVSKKKRNRFVLLANIWAPNLSGDKVFLDRNIMTGVSNC
jgi:hypothetical protein